MALQPATRHAKPPKKTPAEREAPRNAAFWIDMCHLRARTIADDPQDPLNASDWVAVIYQSTKRDNAHMQVNRLRKQQRVPNGIWSFWSSADVGTIDGKPTWVVLARFEGYQPWWKRRSQHADRTSYLYHPNYGIGARWSIDPADTDPPTIDASQYEDRPWPEAMEPLGPPPKRSTNPARVKRQAKPKLNPS